MDPAAEFLRWLDVIPGRNWLIFGSEAPALAGLVHAAYQPAGVSVLDAPGSLPYDTGSFDVVISAAGPLIVSEMRRVLCPAGAAAVFAAQASQELERVFQAAGLHVVRTRDLGDLTAVRGTR